MRKVLIIGYFWPFRGGSARMLGLAKYLPEFGWEPIILTAPLTRPIYSSLKVRVIETPFPGDVFERWRRLFGNMGLHTAQSITEQLKAKIEWSKGSSVLERFRTLYQELFAYPDTEKNWHRPALASARKLISSEKIDAILSVWPVTGHLIARDLKEMYSLPWVADFPDPWSENHAYPYGRIRRWFDRRLEKETLEGADALTAAAPAYARKEESVTNKECKAILLGFEPEQLNDPPAPISRKFSITYTGAIYTENQDPRKFLDALTELLRENQIDRKDLEVNFYGANQEWLRSEFKRRGLDDVAVQHGVLLRTEAIVRQRQAQVLLAFGWESEEQLGVMPYKMFEYLSARRPILIAGGTRKEDFAEIVTSLRAGIHAGAMPEIKSALLDLYREYQINGKVEAKASLIDVEQYSYRVMARQFSDKLTLVARKGHD